MKIQIRRAIYGEKNKAHQLLEHSGEPDPLFEDIKRFTDLPMQLPQGIDWKPYYTGLPYGAAYLLCKTFPDTEANRKGMVLTHVLVAELEQLVRVKNLEPVLDLLPGTPEKGRTIESVELEIDENRTADVENPERFLGAARQLLDDGPRSSPVLWSEEGSFLQLVETIWANAGSAIRRNFSFGTSFVPDDLRDREFTLVSAVISKESKWFSRKLSEPVTGREEVTAAEGFILGLPNATALKSLIGELELGEVRSFTQLRLVSSLAAYLKAIDAGSNVSISEVLSLLRLIEALSPKAHQAGDIKKSTASTLSTLIAGASADDLKRMRNMSLGGFGDSRNLVLKSLLKWIATNAAKTTSTRGSVTELISSSIEDSSGILFEAVQDYFSTVKNPSDLARIVWKLWLTDDANVATLANLIPKTARLEVAFVQYAPAALTDGLAKNLAAWSLERKWYSLHFLASWSYLLPEEAIANQNSKTNQKFRRQWIEPVSKRVKPKVLVKAIVDAGESELSGLALELSLSDPDALRGLDIAKPITQEIFTGVLAKADALDSASVSEIVHSVLDIVVDGRPVLDSLLIEAARSSAADLVDYPGRDRVWEHLPSNVYDDFVLATSSGWLRKFAQSESDDLPIEPALEMIVTRGGFLREFLLASNAKAVSVLVRFYRRFDRLREDQFENDLIAVQGKLTKINYIDSISIGNLIAEREWHRSAARLADDVLTYNRKDVIPAVNRCSHLLGFIQRGWGWVTGKLESAEISQSEWWEIFEEVLADLYPMGPQDSEIWSRARGRKSVLDYNGNGLQRWHSALRDLRNGSGGKNITILGLLNETLRDFPRNDRLNLLRELGKRLRFD